MKAADFLGKIIFHVAEPRRNPIDPFDGRLFKIIAMETHASSGMIRFRLQNRAKTIWTGWKNNDWG